MNFFGIILFIIYIGAISILFIIVIMTINLQITDKNVKNNFYKVLFSLNIFIIFIDKFLFINKNFLILIINSFFELNMNKSLVENIGNTIFTQHTEFLTQSSRTMDRNLHRKSSQISARNGCSIM